MAIITKPTIAKGQANEFDLSKSDLAAMSKIVADSYFSDQANWSKVYIEYKSTEGKQLKQVVFDASEASPKGNFEVSEKARDDWEVQSVKIVDFDGGYLKLQRGDLTVADFDIALGSVGGDVGGLIQSSPMTDSYKAIIEDEGYTVLGNDPSESYAYSTEQTAKFGVDKVYTEFLINANSGGSPTVGFFVGTRENSMVISSIGNLHLNESFLGRPLTFPDKNSTDFNNSTIGLAWDTINNLVYVNIEGNWLNSADPVNGIGGVDVSSYFDSETLQDSYIYFYSVLYLIFSQDTVSLVKEPLYKPEGYKLV